MAHLQLVATAEDPRWREDPRRHETEDDALARVADVLVEAIEHPSLTPGWRNALRDAHEALSGCLADSG